MKRVLAFLKAEDGVTALEYALIGGLIAVVIVVAVTLVGTKVKAQYSNVAAQIP